MHLTLTMTGEPLCAQPFDVIAKVVEQYVSLPRCSNVLRYPGGLEETPAIIGNYSCIRCRDLFALFMPAPATPAMYVLHHGDTLPQGMHWWAVSTGRVAYAWELYSPRTSWGRYRGVIN